ncbi:hypothetical protein GSU69_00355 [Rathayibacter festucae]|uniref:Uncharacterized protein n=1 Tax=Rathayibacter festucae TaxID=110937 RepID=A0ABX6GUV6_9MICO|nr:hypothetical protein [Rathayibacter festucae]QHC61305.1 hypothetical protein GSU69_00355 [Rathayibacter festucae]
MSEDKSGDEVTKEQIHDLIYKGSVPLNKGEHDSFFGSKPGKGQHMTAQEGQAFLQEED